MKKLLTLLLALPLLWGHAAAQENAKYTILLTGASFASPQNGWFEIGCRQLDARAINRAIGGESIADTANRMAEGTLWNAGELDEMDALVIMQVHNRDVSATGGLKEKDAVRPKQLRRGVRLRHQTLPKRVLRPEGRPEIEVLRHEIG